MKKARQSFLKNLQFIFGIVAAILVVLFIRSVPDLLTGVGHVSMAGALVLAGINFSGKSLEELREFRGQIADELNGIVTTCETEKRDLNETEVSRRNELFKSLEKTKDEIRAKELIEEEQREKVGRQAKREKQTEEQKAVASYSFLNALRMAMPNAKLEGLEFEMHQEAIKEAREAGLPIAGFGIPQMILQKRDVTATGQTSVAGDQGGTLIPTMKMGFIDVLRSRLVFQSLGAQFLSGLTGNVSFPKKTGASSSAWGTENADATETQPTFSSIDMSPKRLAAFTEISKQLMLQSSQDIEGMIQNDLELAIRLALEYAAINGPGTGASPKGILNISGIGSVIGGDNGAVPTWANIIDLETKVSAANADLGTMGYLTNSKVRGKLKATPKVANYPDYIWQNGTTPINGYNAAVTNQVPSNLVKGTSGAVASPIIFGNFNDLIIGQWGGLDLVVDPYTKAKNGMVALTINSFWDIAVRHPESFAAMLDALTA